MKAVILSTSFVMGSALLLSAGCIVEDEGRMALESDEGERGEAGAGAAAAGSCFRSCGGSGSEACWCDEQCALLGDCCSDYGTLCVEAGEAIGDGPGGGGAEEPDEPCVKTVVLMGARPPTNDMLRRWSTNPEQNPGTWIGENWGGYGYDVHAFFPEFPPDGDPSNDPVGSEEWAGSREFDLQVDYQAISEDFWRIVDELQPSVIITVGRGGSIGWEIEAVEGGHGSGDEVALDWAPDDYGEVVLPTRASIEQRSWDAIEAWRAGNVLEAELPLEDIEEAALLLGLTSVEIDETGTSGNDPGGFLALHGLAFARTHPEVLAAGHINVGEDVPSYDARRLMESTLDVVLKPLAFDPASCP